MIYPEVAMDSSILSDIFQTGSYQTRTKGQAIDVVAGNARLSYIRKGYVRRYMITNDGSVGVQSIYGPGSLFPLTTTFLALLNQKIYEGDETYFYEAYTDVQFYSLDSVKLAEAAKDDLEVYKAVMAEAGRRLESNIQLLENISLKVPVRRVAHQLVYLARNFGDKTTHGTRIELPLTHQSLSELLNLNRETISRAMGSLSDRGLIKNSPKSVTIPDIAELKTIYL
jgi:CRP/FNR family transcriptional regulator